jgi:hypothetical protein
MAIGTSIPNAKCLALPEDLSNYWAELQAGCAAPIRERQRCFSGISGVVFGLQVRLKVPSETWPNKMKKKTERA